MNAHMPTPEGVVRNPPTSALILGSLACAFGLNLLPWPAPVLLARPDFLLLALIYWCMEEPRQVGASSAFLAGLLMDVAESSFLGQNALVYSLAAYLAIAFRSRVLSFGWSGQSLHLLPILLLGHALVALEHLVLGSPFPAAAWLLRVPLGVLAWPVICWVLEQPRLQAPREEPAS